MGAQNLNWNFKFGRLNPEGIDPSGWHETKADATAYASTSGIAYPGQIIYVAEEDANYTLSPTPEGQNGYVLKPVASEVNEIDGGEF